MTTGQELGQGLSPRVRGLLPLIESSVRQGLSLNDLQAGLRAQGEGVRRAVLSDLRNYYLGIQHDETTLRFARNDRAISPERHTSSITGIKDNFSYTVEVKGINVITGLEKVQHITLRYDVRPLVGDIKEDALEALLNPEYQIENPQVVVVKALKH